MEGSDSCAVCGGDGRIDNAFGRTTTCPACHGSGRRGHEGPLMRDVTKTKASHHGPQAVKGQPVPKQTWPSTFEGGQLAKEVEGSSACATDAKARLIREIIDYEGSHGKCTQTFIKKIRKQLKPAPS